MRDIAQIFVNHPINFKSYDSNPDFIVRKVARAEWFNPILAEMKQFGFNEFEYINPVWSGEKYEPKGDVNIHEFCVLRPMFLRERLALILHPKDEDWSHPIVRQLIEAIVDGSMKGYLQERVLWSLWEPIKLFVNIATTAFRSHMFDLRVRNGHVFHFYEQEADKVLDGILDQLGEKENLAFIFRNNIVLRSNPLDVKVKFDKQEIPFLEFLGDEVRILNEGCRAYKIDIVKDIVTF
jgi:hypothetical protein